MLTGWMQSLAEELDGSMTNGSLSGVLMSSSTMQQSGGKNKERFNMEVEFPPQPRAL